MRIASAVAPACAFAILTGCGLNVPEIQEAGDANDQIQMVQGIVHNINCEIRGAAAQIYERRQHTFMDDWGVQVLLNLTITEQSGISPSVNWLPPSPATAAFSLAAGGSLSSQALRTDKLNSFFTMKQLRALKPCDQEGRPGGPMLMQGDLKLSEWLMDALASEETRQADFNNKNIPKSVLFHEVKFDVVSSGSITPSWKLTRATVNTGTFFSTSRDRSHDLQITIGPTDQSDPVPGRSKTASKPGPGYTAANTALSGDIGASVGSAVRRALLN